MRLHITKFGNHPQRYDNLVFESMKYFFSKFCEVTTEFVEGHEAYDDNFVWAGKRFGRMFVFDLMIITDLDTNKFIVIDQQDSFGVGPGYKLAEHPDHIGSWFTMYQPDWMYDKFKMTYKKFHPAFFLDMSPSETEQGISIVNEARFTGKPLDTRLYFSGTIKGLTPGSNYDLRDVALVLNDKYSDEVVISGEKLSRPDWWAQAAKHWINLTLPGHPWCSREHELWHLGLPLMAYRWNSFVVSQPIPNHDYIAVENVERNGMGVAKDPEDAADKIIVRHRWCLKNLSWVDWVGSNGRMHYRINLTPDEIGRRICDQILYTFKNG